MPSLILSDRSLMALDFVTENIERLQDILKMEEIINRNQGYYNIVMPKFHGEFATTTIKVNKKIWNEFSQFASKQKYSKQDLISLAFKEFIDNHKD